MRDTDLDDIDQLFARLERVEPPPGFSARVMERIAVDAVGATRQPSWRRGIAYGLAYLAALMALAVLAFSLGSGLEHNGTDVLVGTLVQHIELLSYAPSAYLGAVAASIPWLQVAGLTFDLVVLAVVTRLLLRGPRPDHHPLPGPRAASRR